MLGDPDSRTDDHQVRVAVVTSHVDGVVDRRLDVGVHRCSNRVLSMVDQWGIGEAWRWSCGCAWRE
jgi:hypothetical protein